MPYSKPFHGDYPVTSNFGKRPPLPNHDGIDFGCPKGTPILAIESGKVIVSQLDQNGGNWVDIQLDNGLVARYLHFSQRLVNVGDRVSSGQLIGYSGGVKGEFGSGFSTGAHLHLGIKKNGQFYNWYPELWNQMKDLSQTQSAQSVNTPSSNSAPVFQHFDILKDFGPEALTAWQVMSSNATNFGNLSQINEPTRSKVFEVVTSEPDNGLTYLCQELGRTHQTVNGLNATIANLYLEINDLKTKVGNVTTPDDYQSLKDGTYSLKVQLETANQNLVDLQNQLQNANQQIDNLKGQLAVQPDSNTITSLQDELSQKQKLLDQLNAEKVSYEKQIAENSLNKNTIPETKTSSTDKYFFQSKKWLSGFLNTVVSTGILVFQTSKISLDDDWKTIATKLGSAVATILGINFVSSSYISGQSKVDTATAENTQIVEVSKYN